MDTGIKIAVLLLLGWLVYREILKAAAGRSPRPAARAGFVNLLMVGGAVGIFTYAGMSMTWIETRDLRPYVPPGSAQMVSLYDKGVIELNGMVIQTHLAEPGELAPLAERLTRHCNGDQGCEAQSLFDYVTAIPYRTDHTSRTPREVLESGWGDCDDKTNLFASLLNEKGIEYRLIYVPHHVFMAVHLSDTDVLPFLSAKLRIGKKEYYYAETTAKGAKIGEFNGQFPGSFEGIYDLENDTPVDPETVAFRFG